MERVWRAFLFCEELATKDEEASLEEALEHVLWCVHREARQLRKFSRPRFVEPPAVAASPSRH